jgi:hypothetical protein
MDGKTGRSVEMLSTGMGWCWIVSRLLTALRTWDHVREGVGPKSKEGLPSLGGVVVVDCFWRFGLGSKGLVGGAEEGEGRKMMAWIGARADWIPFALSLRVWWVGESTTTTSMGKRG